MNPLQFGIWTYGAILLGFVLHEFMARQRLKREKRLSYNQGYQDGLHDRGVYREALNLENPSHPSR